MKYTIHKGNEIKTKIGGFYYERSSYEEYYRTYDGRNPANKKEPRSNSRSSHRLYHRRNRRTHDDHARIIYSGNFRSTYRISYCGSQYAEDRYYLPAMRNGDARTAKVEKAKMRG